MSSHKSLATLAGSISLSLVTPASAQQNTTVDGEWRAFLPAPHKAETQRPVRDEPVVPTLTNNTMDSSESPVEQNIESGTIRVGSILIEAQTALDHSIFETVIESYLGKDVGNDDLAKLAQEIAELARSQGMVLANAHVPRQKIEMGIVKVILEVGKIDEIRIVGSSNRSLRKLLDPLVGKVAIKQDLERRLMLANNIPQISVKSTRLESEGDHRILVVIVENRKKSSGQLVLDNFGSERIGPLRARLSVEAVALLSDADYLNATFRTNPVDSGELQGASAVYGTGLNNDGTRAEVATAWSRSNIDPGFGYLRREAKSQYASLSVTHPLRRARKSNLWVDGQFEYLKIQQKSYDVLLQSDTVVTLSTSLSSSSNTGNGWLRMGAQIRQGLGLFGANGAGDMLSSRFDADGRFTSGRAWINWSGKPHGDMTLRIAVTGQLASEPLLSSEEIGIGGGFLGRAYEFYERSGDQGILGLTEVGYEFSRPFKWLRRFQPYAFMDGGYVDNLRDGYGSGTLMSAGGGVRADIGRFGVQLETAVPVYQSGDTVRDSSSKINLQVGLEF